jgi:hypothetical protein
MRLRHPLAEGGMKLLDKAFDRAVEMAKPVQMLADGLKAVAEQMKNLAENLAVVAHNQAVHHHMITQMWGVQQVIYKRLRENSLDTSMPEIDKHEDEDDKKKADKPN